MQTTTSKGGTKRKKVVGSDPKSKICKVEGNVSLSKVSTESNDSELGNHNQKDSNLESKLEAQSKEFWAMIDELKSM